MTLYTLGYIEQECDYFINQCLLTYDEAKSDIIYHMAKILLKIEKIDADISLEEIFKNDVVINKNIYLERSNDYPDGSIDISLFKKITKKGYMFNTYTSKLLCKFFIKATRCATVDLEHKFTQTMQDKCTLSTENELDENKSSLSVEPIKDERDTSTEFIIDLYVQGQEETRQIATMDHGSLLQELKMKLDKGLGSFLNPPELNVKPNFETPFQKNLGAELRRRRRRKK